MLIDIRLSENGEDSFSQGVVSIESDGTEETKGYP